AQGGVERPPTRWDRCTRADGDRDCLGAAEALRWSWTTRVLLPRAPSEGDEHAPILSEFRARRRCLWFVGRAPGSGHGIRLARLAQDLRPVALDGENAFAAAGCHAGAGRSVRVRRRHRFDPWAVDAAGGPRHRWDHDRRAGNGPPPSRPSVCEHFWAL